MEFIYSLKLLPKQAWALPGRPRCLIEAPSSSHVKFFFFSSPQLTVSDAGKEEEEKEGGSIEAFRPEGAQRWPSQSDRGAAL